jgi:hypothetical protein
MNSILREKIIDVVEDHIGLVQRHHSDRRLIAVQCADVLGILIDQEINRIKDNTPRVFNNEGDRIGGEGNIPIDPEAKTETGST